MTFIFAQAAGNSGLTTILFVGLLIAVFYFFMIRPQRTRARKHREVVESLAVGDEIQTIGGIQGRIRSIHEDTITVSIDEGQITFAKRAVANKVAPPAAES